MPVQSRHSVIVFFSLGAAWEESEFFKTPRYSIEVLQVQELNKVKHFTRAISVIPIHSYHGIHYNLESQELSFLDFVLVDSIFQYKVPFEEVSLCFP